MKLSGVRFFSGLVALALPLGLAAGAAPKPAAKPAPAKISYERDVKPLLARRCYACHGNGTRLGGFQVDSREGVLTGSQNMHPVVLPGKGAQSYLVKLVSGKVPGKIMPPKGAHLTPAEVAVLRAWIDQGVSFGASGGVFTWRAPLAPREVKLPAAGPANYIDRLLVTYFRSHKIALGAVVDDRTYARRVYLDTIGMLPSTDDLHSFLADKSPDKRARLARRLLADNERYAEHWLTFWNDALRNDYTGAGYIDGGRLQITGWLYNALATNMPYDQFVRELVNPTPESAGFAKGIVWRGVVNASQTPEMQAAQNISQVFMGINLKCASCHDSFISTWKLADSYGMAGIYAEGPLEMVRCDKPQGKVAPIRFLYPELGAIDASQPRPKRMEQLAAVLTSSKNGRLARTMVNRLWTKLMGRGLVEPNDDMDARPWDPDLLDWLASDFAAHGYDVKRTIEQIVTSRAYQLPAMALSSEQSTEFVFSGPAVKRLSAEQFVDAVSELTGVWSKPAVQFAVSKGQPALPARAKVVFKTDVMRSGSTEIDADVTGAKVLSLLVTDGGNGGNFDWADWINPRIVTPQGEVKLTSIPWRSATTGYGQIQLGKSIVEKPLRLAERTFEDGIGTHANSIITYILPEGTTRFRATAGPDQGAVESQNTEVSVAFFVVAGDRSLVETRAALAANDPLMRALGRPNREQVVTQRSTVATTLQALELTNGQTLTERLSQGAQSWLSERGKGLTPPQLVDRIYETSLERLPTVVERTAAVQMVGSPARKDGVEDLLWAVVMLPDFQLVY